MARPADAHPSEAPATTVAPLPERALLHYFLDGYDDGDNTELVRQFQEAVARCMREKGFEYVPVVSDEPAVEYTSPPVDEEYYAIRGFGISIERPPEDITPTSEFVDPNAPYVASLTEAGRRAYDEALNGRPVDEGNRGSRDPDDLGCMLVSSEEVEAAHPAPTTPPLVVELEEQVTIAYYGRLETDRRMIEAEATLADCAAAAGATDYDPTPDGMQVGYGDHLYTPFLGWRAYDQVWQAWEELTADGEPDAAALAGFQTWERDMAVAEYRCNAPVRAVMGEISDEVLREIVGPHRAELEDLAASWPAG